jgi:hypothetical protein
MNTAVDGAKDDLQEAVSINVTSHTTLQAWRQVHAVRL